MAKNKKEEQTYGAAFEKITQEEQNQINQVNNGISFKISTNIVLDDTVNPFVEKVAMTDGTNAFADDATGTPKTEWDKQDERVTSGNSWDDKTISIVS
jgi:hypothetical protein